ncbi:MAG TPA: hypothetical protein PKC22_07675 [Rhodocyclaceae bacterium]|nr:hypothetical protein [Rhodocyclaceae bacterium]
MSEVEDMYRLLAIANYEDRFVIPTTHREYAENAYDLRAECGFSFGNGCSEGAGEASLFGGKKRRTIPIKLAPGRLSEGGHEELSGARRFAAVSGCGRARCAR